jgi:predicted RND superfamily exporter protein
MSAITHEDLRVSHRAEIFTARHRMVLRRVLERGTTVLIGFAIMAAVVTTVVGFKAFAFLSRMPLLP